VVFNEGIKASCAGFVYETDKRAGEEGFIVQRA